MSERRKKGDEFDWIAVRWDCSLTAVFEKLKAQVRMDVENIQRRRPEGAMNKIEFTNNGNHFIVVLSAQQRILDAASFTLKDNEILVSNKDDKELFRAVPSIDDEGDCILKIGEKECELWQVRKAALEKLLFRTS